MERILSMAMDHFDPELDALLADVHRLLDDDQTAPMTADDVKIDYDQLYEDSIPAPPKASGPSRPSAPVSDETMIYRPQEQARPKSWTETQKLPKHVAKLQQNQEQAYADWLYEQGRRGSDVPPPSQPQKRKKKPEPEPEYDYYEEAPEPKGKKHHFFRNFVIFLVILALALAAAVLLVLPKQPKASTGTLGSRKEGVSTILIAGTDAGGVRTDTLILLTVDQSGRTVSLVSVPRDTLVNGGYTVPKINSVYGANNGGVEGMDMVMTRVAECIGFRPDGYVLIELDAFVDFIDALGGVEFDVPVDMFYNDPSQDLYIDLKAGTRKLSGEEAMGLVRFRSGYADADLGRVQVQRQFLSAVMDQTASLKGVLKSPKLLNVLLDNAYSDMTVPNYLWLARAILLSDLKNVQTATLPGNARNFSGGSYYVLDPTSVAQTVNTYCNPYQKDVTTEDLNIRQG